MQGPPDALGIFGGTAHNMQHRNMLGVASCDGIGGGEFTDAECGDQGRHAAEPPVSVRGVAGVELIGVTHPADIRMGDNVIEKLKVVVTRDAKYLSNPELDQPVEEIIADGVDSIGGASRGSSHQDDATFVAKGLRSAAASLLCEP